MPNELRLTLPSQSPEPEAILKRLQEVLDPELDESILQLGFIDSLQIKDGHVTIDLKLPTSWCSPNFVYMMAEEIHRVLLTIETVQKVTVHLGDHFLAKEIELCVNTGEGSAEVFPGEGVKDLNDLRRAFVGKAFAARQERFLRKLRGAGLSTEEICGLSLGDVASAGGTCLVRRPAGQTIEVGPAELLNRYVECRVKMGHDCSPTRPLITDVSGRSIPIDQLETHFREIRTTRVSLEANSSFCRALLNVRNSI